MGNKPRFFQNIVRFTIFIISFIRVILEFEIQIVITKKTLYFSLFGFAFTSILLPLVVILSVSSSLVINLFGLRIQIINFVLAISSIILIIVGVCSYYITYIDKKKTKQNIKKRLASQLGREASQSISPEEQKDLRELEKRFKELIIVQKFLDNDMKNAVTITTISTIFVIFYGGINIYLNYQSPYTVSLRIVSLIATLIIFFKWLQVIILNYRIKKGYFGNNKYEALAIIQFVEKHFDDMTPPGSENRNIKMFPDNEEEISVSNSEEGEGEFI